MLKRIVCTIFMLSLGCHIGLKADQKAEEIVLILNMKNVEEVPVHFRTTRDSLHFSNLSTEPSTIGLEVLQASGSGQFSEKGLQATLKKLKHPSTISIVDLRQESHGFINGIAVSWFVPKNWGNIGKTLTQIDQQEHNLLQAILKDKTASISIVLQMSPEDYILKKDVQNVTLDNIATEKELANSTRIGYIRIPVTDHLRPSNVDVDQFIEFVRKLPKGTWLHFHCSDGGGRTTTLMAMYDMMHNAKKVGLDDILNRQWLLGGIQLESLPNIGDWKYDLEADRAVFLKRFYEYCQMHGDGFKTSWSDYVKKLIDKKNVK